jgi:SAM-dependent methyltransferase
MTSENDIPEKPPLPPIDFNQQAWNQVAREGDRFFRAVSQQQLEQAKAGGLRIRVTPQKNIPLNWLLPLQHQKVLCLAGGGGQQGPLLAAAGAEVTVLDLSDRQLARDQQIAREFGLTLRLEAGDMADLSRFPSHSFDLIVNPCSACYCPDLTPVWREAFRVLKPGGKLISGLINPVYYLFDAIEMERGRLVARHKIPYSDLNLEPAERERILGEHRPLEYGHSLTDLLGGQLRSGFQLIAMLEDGWAMNDYLSSLIPTFLATCAIRPVA